MLLSKYQNCNKYQNTSNNYVFAALLNKETIVYTVHMHVYMYVCIYEYIHSYIFKIRTLNLSDLATTITEYSASVFIRIFIAPIISFNYFYFTLCMYVRMYVHIRTYIHMHIILCTYLDIHM